MQDPTATQDSDRLAEAIEKLADAIATSGGAPAGEAAEAAADPASDAASALTEVPGDLEGIQGWIQAGKEQLLEFLPSLAVAVAILVVGWMLAKLVTSIAKAAMGRTNLDSTLSNFLGSVLYMMLMVFVIVSAIAKLGVNTASFVAVLGAAGFAVGFAMQGSLSNFAAGVMIMIFRPIREGELVEAGGVLGVVKEVGVFATVINTIENKKAIIANAAVMGGNIINYTANGMLRVDMTYGIGYGDDVDKAISVLEGVLAADSRVLKDPAPTVALVEHGASSINLVCRPFVHPDHYWDVWFDTHKAVKKAFDEQGITIPFPQRDVHLFQQPA